MCMFFFVVKGGKSEIKILVDYVPAFAIVYPDWFSNLRIWS